MWAESLIIDDYPLHCISENPAPPSSKTLGQRDFFPFFPPFLNAPMWSSTQSQWVNEGFCIEIWESLQQWLMGRRRVGRFCSWQRALIQALLEITGARAALLAPHGRTWCGRERARCASYSVVYPHPEKLKALQFIMSIWRADETTEENLSLNSRKHLERWILGKIVEIVDRLMTF